MHCSELGLLRCMYTGEASTNDKGALTYLCIVRVENHVSLGNLENIMVFAFHIRIKWQRYIASALFVLCFSCRAHNT